MFDFRLPGALAQWCHKAFWCKLGRNCYSALMAMEHEAPKWLSAQEQGTTLYLLIQPKASVTVVVGEHGTPVRLKIRIAAPLVDGRANEALLAFLKKTLDVSLRDLQLMRGQKSRQKDVYCRGLTAKQVQSRLKSV